jgi:ABC-type transporter Mla MlaB component
LPQRRKPEPILFAVGGVVDRKHIPAWCACLLARLERDAGDPVVCDVAGLIQADAVAVDLLARLVLTARRAGHRLWVRHASTELRELIALMGMSEVIALESGSALPSRRQPEQREQSGGVEEKADPGDRAL